MHDAEDRLDNLVGQFKRLSQDQIALLESIVAQLSQRQDYKLHCEDLFDDYFLNSFGDTLLIHHCFSDEPFTKDHFEYALVRVARVCGKTAIKAPKGTQGYDVEIDNERFSLKTQADAHIREDKIWISKFMELGRGKWGSDPNDLVGLRDQFLARLAESERIFSLRSLSKDPHNWHYELVEIPKSLLECAATGDLEMKVNSTQADVKPGYCYVKDDSGNRLFYLYFDGGGERKLQIKHIRKDKCTVHAEWRFRVSDLY